MGNNGYLESRNNFSFLLAAWRSRRFTLVSRFLLSAFAFAFCFLLSQFLLLPSFAQTNVTPERYLQMQHKPNFAQGYHLPRLTKWGWLLSTNLNIECALNWGYCLDLGMMGTNEVAQIGKINNANFDGWTSDQFNGLIRLASNNPSQFPVSVNIQVLQSELPILAWPAGYWVTNCNGDWVKKNPTNVLLITATTNSANDVASLEGPDSYWSTFSSNQVWGLSVIRSNIPISIVLVDGEYGAGVSGNSFLYYYADCRAQSQSVFTNPYSVYTNSNPYISSVVNTNGMSWPHYSSIQKTRQQKWLTDDVRQVLPDRQLFIYYDTGNEQYRSTTQYGNSYIWLNNYPWGFWSSLFMGTNQATGFGSLGINSDMVSFEDYFKGENSWTNHDASQYSNGYDLLTLHLNAVGYNFTLGYTNNYSWFNGGWSLTDSNLFSDIPTYTGFLKCLYTAGTVGGVAGYFSFPTGTVASIFGENGFAGTFPTNIPPHWLLQIMALSHVHALFSHLENVLTNGDLLSGPQYHALSHDQPAYEFTNTAGYVNDRVLARKMRSTNLWIVTAWAADGITNNVTVTIPTIGNLSVNAIPSASVYQVTISGTNVQQTLLDEYASFQPAAPINLRVLTQ